MADDVVSRAIGDMVPNISMDGVINVVGWFVFAILLIGGGFWAWYSWKQKKVFGKIINVHSQVGKFWKKTYTDLAKPVKIGSGGFEVLFLQKLKVYRIGYGGNFGDNTYDYYVMPDGYWYNSRQYGDVKYLDKNGGLLAVLTTNPLMRGQYATLEKQINELHGEKANFWDKYGGWVLAISFILISGVMLWLSYKQFATVSGNLAGAVTEMGELTKQLASLASNMQGIIKIGGTAGLVPV